MHANANITCDLNETDAALDVLLSLQPRDTGASGKGDASKKRPQTREEIIETVAATTIARLPPPFDVEAISMAYPVVRRGAWWGVRCRSALP